MMLGERVSISFARDKGEFNGCDKVATFGR